MIESISQRQSQDKKYLHLKQFKHITYSYRVTTTVAYLFILTLIFIITTLHSKSDIYYHRMLSWSEQRHKYSVSIATIYWWNFKWENDLQTVLCGVWCKPRFNNAASPENSGTNGDPKPSSGHQEDLWFSFLFQFLWKTSTKTLSSHHNRFHRPYYHFLKTIHKHGKNFINNAKFIYPNIF